MSAKKIDLTQEFTLKGTWWLPNTPNHQVAGLLKFKPEEGLVLEVYGSLEPNRSSLDPTEHLCTPQVYGTITNGKQCSLLRLFERNGNYSTDFQTSEFTVNFAVIGVLTPSLESLECQSVSIQYTNLEAWIPRKVFSAKLNLGNKSRNPSMSITSKVPKSFRYSVPAINGTITLEPSFIASSDPCSRTLQYTESIRIRPRSRKPLIWFYDQSHHLRNLLSLFATERFFFKNFKMQLGRKKLPRLGNKMIPIEAEFIFHQEHFTKVRELNEFNIPFTHSVVRQDLQTILETWFRSKDILKPTHDLFFESFYNQQLAIQFQFLALTQALESLHRQLHRGCF